MSSFVVARWWRLWRVGKPVASLGWVSHGAETEGVTPIFFWKKNWRPYLFFSHHRLPVLSPLLLKKLTTFLLLITINQSLIDFTRVSRASLRRVPSRTFLPLRPHLSTVLCKFVHIFLRSGVTPGGCHRGDPPSAPPSPSDATGKSTYFDRMRWLRSRPLDNFCKGQIGINRGADRLISLRWTVTRGELCR